MKNRMSVLCVIFLGVTHTIDISALTSKEVISGLNNLPQQMSLYQKMQPSTINKWAEQAQAAGKLIEEKEPSLHTQFAQDQHVMTQMLTTIGAIYEEIIKPVADEGFGGSYNIKKLAPRLASLKEAQKKIAKGGTSASLSVWKNKEGREVFNAFKKVIKNALASAITQAEQIIKEKGLIVR
jgi:hypothetical protein